MGRKLFLTGLAVGATALFGLKEADRYFARVEAPKEERKETPYIPTPKVSPIVVEKTLTEKEELEIFANYIMTFEAGGNEDKINTVYDGNGNPKIYEPNIGYGHNLSSNNSLEGFRKSLPGVSHSLVCQGKLSLTREQMKDLFIYDLKEHVERAKKDIPNFSQLPIEVKTVFASMAYRGEDNPNTLRLFNAGLIREAAQEYLDNKEYRSARSKGNAGVEHRMNAHHEVIVGYASQLERKSVTN